LLSRLSGISLPVPCQAQINGKRKIPVAQTTTPVSPRLPYYFIPLITTITLQIKEIASDSHLLSGNKKAILSFLMNQPD